MKRKAIVLNPKNNVATVLTDCDSGELLEIECNDEKIYIGLTDSIPLGHKLSLSRIDADSSVIKYGEVIGISSAPIEPGDYVHIHNVVSARGRGDLEGGAE